MDAWSSMENPQVPLACEQQSSDVDLAQLPGVGTGGDCSD